VSFKDLKIKEPSKSAWFFYTSELALCKNYA